jgi:tryptophan synthase alpha chain
MNRIDDALARLKANGRKAFIPFVTAGDPDLKTTGRLVRELASRGSSLIEIGFPYSDPIADGAVIQASYNRALTAGLQISQIFTAARQWAECGVPLVGMVSYSLVHRRGPERFLDEAKAAGFSGLIVPDLPAEEADTLAPLAAARDVKLILLVTPTTPKERANRIAKLSTGFLYCVSVTGITGERDRLPQELLVQLAWLREQTSLPLCVGFGISKPEHVKMLREAADGVIVGSAFVRKLEQVPKKSADDVIADVGELAGSLVKALE